MVGLSSAKTILDEAKVSMIRKVNEWSDDESNSIRKIIGEKYTVEG